jgi:hypothetical protein
MPETPNDLIHDLANAPKELVHEVEELAHEAELGESARTPAIAVTGIALVVGAVVVVLLVIAFLAYYLA